MKLKNIYFIPLLAGAVVAGCADDIEDFDNQLFMTSKTPQSVLVKSTFQDVAVGFTMSIAKPADADVTFSVAADPGLVSTYEAQNYVTGMEALDASHYELLNANGKIAAGALTSDSIKIQLKDIKSLDTEKTYILPVTVTGSSIGVLASANTQYFVFKGAALINKVANINKNNVYINKWADASKFKAMKTMTVECLIRPHSFGDGREDGISTLMGIEGNFLFRFGDRGVPSNQLQIATGKASNFLVEKAVELEKWIHIAITYDSETQAAKVYYDGKLEGDFSNVSQGPVDWSPEHSDEADGKPRCFWIGYSYSDKRWLDADISEVRIWDRVLSEDEINAKDHFYDLSVPDSEGLLVYWKFDDGSDIIKDHSGNGNDAVSSEPLTWVEVSLPEKDK